MYFRRRLASSLFLLSLITGTITFGLLRQQVKAVTQTVAVTASVLAKPIDFQGEIVSDVSGNIEQNTVVTYTITYGSRLLYGDSIKVEAQWYPGLPDGSSPSDIFEYVPGSASLAYGSTAPFIDSVNQKIKWDIPNLPANTTGQTVTFQLKTNSSYTGNNKVDLPVRVRVISRTASSTDQVATVSYKYHGSPVVITATNEPASSPTPTPVVSAAPTVSPSPSSITTTSSTSTKKLTTASVVVKKAVPSLTLLSLVDNAVKLAVQTPEASTINVSYGTTPLVTKEVPSDETLSSLHTVVLNNLEPNTDHFVQVEAINSSGEVTKSDVYVYKTAVTSEQPQVQLPTVTFLTSNVTLFSSDNILNDTSSESSSTKAESTPIIVLPKNTLYSFHFASTKTLSIKKVLVLIRDAQVLGASTEQGNQSTANTLSTQLILAKNGNFEGNLKSPAKPGKYEVFAQIFDTDGNIVENKIADLRVSLPFRVIAKDSRNPIEKAEVLLSYWSDKTKSFVLLPPQLFSSANPDYTDVEGNLANLALPQGKYQVKVSATRYKTATVDFTIGPDQEQDYPNIILERESFNIVTMLKYFTEVFRDFADKRVTHLRTVAQSSRFFELNILIVTGTLVFLTLISFSTRIRIPLQKLPKYLWHRTRILFAGKDITELVKGIVVDKLTGQPVSGADVFFVDERKRQIVAHKRTGTDGKFSFVKVLSTLEAIEVMAEGYEPFALDADSYVCEESHEHVLELEKSTRQKQLWEDGLSFFEKFLGLIFEFILIQTIIFELTFGFVLGWPKTAPFFVISVVNLGLWLLHLTHRRTEQSVG